MIQGEVTATLDITVPLRLRDRNQEEREVTAVLDTGFNDYLTLPSALIRELNLPLVDVVDVRMADQRVVQINLYLVYVNWQNEERLISAQEAEGDPLIGMLLLLGNHVTFETKSGGSVTIDVLP